MLSQYWKLDDAWSSKHHPISTTLHVELRNSPPHFVLLLEHGDEINSFPIQIKIEPTFLKKDVLKKPTR